MNDLEVEWPEEKRFDFPRLIEEECDNLERMIGEILDSALAEITCGELQINLARRRVTKGRTGVHLTRTEYNLLHELAMHRNQVLLHQQLLTAVWGPEYRDDLDYLRAHIRYLRRKLEPDPANPRYIVTSPGVGYMLECPEEA